MTTSRCTAPRSDSLSGVGLATVVAALHLAVLAARVSGRHHPVSSPLLSWQTPTAPDAPATDGQEPPSNPHRNYAVGELALTLGMAVVGLTRWLHVMRINGARTY